MASELRWILLGIGLVLVAGLWWWERRRSSVPPEESPLRSQDRFEPRLDAESAAAEAHAAAAEPALRTLDERPVPHGDPPLVTIEDLPENTDSVVLAPGPVPDERHASTATTAMERRRPRPDPPPPEPSAAAAAPQGLIERQPEPPSEPEPEPPSRQQRIVAIRLLGERERRIDGAELQKALASEGLEFGRYSIYHKILHGGRPVFSVASLVEPGSFDPDLIASLRFPGISMFAVYPGPIPAPQAFDELLATARRLADRLGGSLQDDSGSSLTGQRVLSIREELVHFEHLVALSRTRPGA